MSEIKENNNDTTTTTAADDPFSRRPKDSAFYQQRLPAWQPLLTPKWVISTFALVGAIFLPIGIIVLTASNSVVEIRERYDDRCGLNTTCFVNLTVPEEMKSPVYFYYELNNYYQNHRRYVKSRSDTQLRGEIGSDIGECEPTESGLNGKTLVPCGLISASYFNDTFTACTRKAGSNTCNNLNWGDGGIAWKSDIEDKFKPISSADFDNTRYTRFTEDGVYIDAQKSDTQYDPAFIVWMRTAGLPDFKKLRYKYNGELAEGTVIQLTINNNYPVAKFNGEKYIVFSTTSWLGGRNPFLAWSYIVVGILCLVLAGVFFAKQRVAPRKLGDMAYFRWSGDNRNVIDRREAAALDPDAH